VSEAKDLLGSENPSGDATASQEVNVVVPDYLSRVSAQRMGRPGELLLSERGKERRERKIGPDRPHPEARRSIHGQSVARRAPHDLVAMVAIMGRRTKHERNVKGAHKPLDFLGERPLRQLQVVVPRDLQRWVEDLQVETRAEARLDRFTSSAFLLIRPAKRASDIDNPVTRIPQSQKRRRRADYLVIRMRRKVQHRQGISHARSVLRS
jgi:hypothetical protein